MELKQKIDLGESEKLQKRANKKHSVPTQSIARRVELIQPTHETQQTYSSASGSDRPHDQLDFWFASHYARRFCRQRTPTCVNGRRTANALPPPLTQCRPPTNAHVRQRTPDRQRTATSVDAMPSTNGRRRASTCAGPSTHARVIQRTPDRQRTPASGNAPDASTDDPVCCREHSSTDLNHVDVQRCANAHPLRSTRVPGGVMESIHTSGPVRKR